MLRVEIALRGDTAKQFSTCVRRISWLLIRLFAYWDKTQESRGKNQEGEVPSDQWAVIREDGGEPRMGRIQRIFSSFARFA